MEPTDLLQSKITEAKAQLPRESLAAINSVDWKLIILGMKEKFNDDQLDTLTMETELLLCGLVNPDNYSKRLEEGMKITEGEATLLINEMDRLVFKKIQNNLEKAVMAKGGRIENEIPLPPYSARKPETVSAFGSIPNNIGYIEIKPAAATPAQTPSPASTPTPTAVPVPPNPAPQKIIVENIFDPVKAVQMEQGPTIPASSVAPIPPNPAPSNQVPPAPAPSNPPVANIMEEKMAGPTVSEHSVSDYSISPVPNKIPPADSAAANQSPKPHDPYREEI